MSEREINGVGVRERETMTNRRGQKVTGGRKTECKRDWGTDGEREQQTDSDRD